MREACLADTRPDATPNSADLKIAVLELGPGRVMPGRSGQLRCSSVLPVRMESIPRHLQKLARPRSRWWAPAYGGC